MAGTNSSDIRDKTQLDMKSREGEVREDAREILRLSRGVSVCRSFFLERRKGKPGSPA